MTTKAAFSPEEWKTVLQGPPTAGMIVVTAARGGTIRETIAMAKAYSEAHAQPGESELIDEIVAARPEVDHSRFHSAESSKSTGSPSSAPPLRCSRARRPPVSSTTTGTLCWPSPARSRLRTANTVNR